VKLSFGTFLVLLSVAFAGCSKAPSAAPAKAAGPSAPVVPPSPRSVHDVYVTLVHMLGDPAVSVEERRHIRELIKRAADHRATTALIEGSYDRRECDPHGRVPSNPDFTSVTVGEECDLLLFSIWGIRLRSAYQGTIGDWRTWWSARKDKSPEEIREEIRKYNETHEP